MMKTNRNTVIRLTRYKNSLYRFKSLGFVKVFSDNLADSIGVTASQVRKDFSMFGISGNKKGGYQVVELIEKLNQILGKDRIHDVIVAGCGNIGSALMNYKGFESEGLNIKGCFEIDPGRIDKACQPNIMHIDEMRNFIKENNIKIGIIAVPDVAAQQILEIMVSSGIKGVLNFAPIRLRGREDTVIVNVNLVQELESVIYFTNAEKSLGSLDA